MDLIDLLTNKKNYDKINDLWWSMLGSRTYWGEHKKQNNELIEEGIGIYNVRHEAKHAGIFKNNTTQNTTKMICNIMAIILPTNLL